MYHILTKKTAIKLIRVESTKYNRATIILYNMSHDQKEVYALWNYMEQQ